MQIKKKKRNEEKYKLSLKLFLKYFSENSDIKKENPEFSITFIKTIINKAILSEIAHFLHINVNELLKTSIISKGDQLISRFKEIYLYKKSKIFRENFGNFVKNNLIQNYQKTRKFKIYTIVEKIISKINLDVDLSQNNFIIDEFFENKKIKMPWSDDELKITKEFSLEKLVDSRLN